MAFPKHHRDRLRQQYKVWNTKTEKISNNGDKDDVKAHVLSYTCWLYGIGSHKLGTWPAVRFSLSFSLTISLNTPPDSTLSGSLLDA